MFRSSSMAFALIMALCCTMSVVSLSDFSCAQEGATAGQQPGFTPTAVVQDEGSLTEKASYFVGFKMMKDLEGRKAGEVNMKELFEGMKEASTSDEKKSYIVGYQTMKDLQRQGGDKTNMKELFAGMEAAAAGEDKKNFVAGFQMMSGLKEQGYGLSLDKIFEGMMTASSGKELGMSDEEVMAMMNAFQKVVEKRQIEKMKKTSADNIAAAEAYMAKNAADNPNVKMLENGVQYEILTEGTGPVPTIANKVKVDYHGTFLNGRVFDSSINPPSGRPPAPAELKVGEFVPGFSEVLQNMKVGGKWRVVIPGQQAYGIKGGARGMIGPNQALVFEVTLLEITE